MDNNLTNAQETLTHDEIDEMIQPELSTEEITICDKKITLRPLPQFWFKKIKKMITPVLIDRFNTNLKGKEEFVTYDLFMSMTEILDEIFDDKIGQVVEVIAEFHNLGLDAETIEKQMTPDELLTIVVLQWEKNKKMDKRAVDFFLRIPFVRLMVNVAKAYTNQEEVLMTPSENT